MEDDGGRWMTFSELAALRSTTKRAAVMLVRRHGWRRQRNNAGHAIALVPATWAQPPEAAKGSNGSDHSAGHGAEHSGTDAAAFPLRALAALEQALSALQESHSRELSALHETHKNEMAALQAELTTALANAQAERAARNAQEADLEATREAARRAEAALDR